MTQTLANNIIFAFTYDYNDNNSQYITYIDFSLIDDISSINIISKLNPSDSIIAGLKNKFNSLHFKMKEFIF